MCDKIIYYYLGGPGSNVRKVAYDFSKKNPDYIFIDFIKIMVNQPSYPTYLNSEPYVKAILASNNRSTDATIDGKNIIFYGSGINFKLQKLIGYLIIIRYINISIEKTIRKYKNN